MAKLNYSRQREAILDFLCHERSKSFLLKRAVYFFSRQTVISILSDRFIPRNAPIKN